MTNIDRQATTRNRQQWSGFLLLVVAIISLPFLNYYFSNFYRGTLQDYKSWYPRFFFIIFPVVKILPFAIIGILFLLLHVQIVRFLRMIAKLPVILFSTCGFLKKIASRYLPGILILSVTLAIILPVIEYALRKQGFKPGYRLYSIYFHQVDSLFELSGFYADSNGIFCISREAGEFISEEIKTKSNVNELVPLKANQSHEVYYLRNHFLKLREKNYSNEFKSFLETLESPADTADIEFFNAIKNYALSPVNSFGFKSIEFKKYNPKRKSILLLGDSFTWGHTAKNITDCFADLLLTNGYVVYNSGITGTDPAQYLQVAKALVPVLEPDYVVVNFYMGNDIKYIRREPQPYVPIFYCTNAGNLIACPDGIYFKDAQEAYDYSLSNFTIPKGIPFNDFCSKFTLTTLLWKGLVLFGIVDGSIPQFREYFRKAGKLRMDSPYSDVELSEIKKITEAHCGKFLLTVIPSLDGKKFLFPKDDPKIFHHLEYFVPPISKKHYHQQTDGHYNSSGHAMHADFIDSLIRLRMED